MAKTYKEWEDEAKKSGYYDTFSDEDLNQIKGDVAYGDNMLAGKKRYDAAETPEEKAAIADEFANERLQRGYYNTVQGDGKGGYRATSTTAASLGGAQQPTSKFNTVNRLLAEIAGDKFSYDAKNDKRYKLAEEYAQQAMANQMAESALLTGGYGNSYAAAAGQQVYTDYMNDAVNDMEDRAYSRWAADRDYRYNLLNMARDMEQEEYNRGVYEEEKQYTREQDAKNDARNTVYDHIMVTGSLEGLSPEEIAATGWSEGYLNGLIAKSQKENVVTEDNKPLFSAEAALKYYMGGNKSANVLEAMQYYFGDDYAENADAYYKNMMASTPTATNTTPTVGEVNPFDFSEVYAQLEESGAYDYESALNLLIAKGYKTTEAEAIAKGFANGRVDRTADSYVTHYLEAKRVLRESQLSNKEDYVISKLEDALDNGRISEAEYWDILREVGILEE